MSPADLRQGYLEAEAVPIDCLKLIPSWPKVGSKSAPSWPQLKAFGDGFGRNGKIAARAFYRDAQNRSTWGELEATLN